MSASNRRMFLTTSNTLLETNVILPLLEVVISFLRKQTNETKNQHSKCSKKIEAETGEAVQSNSPYKIIYNYLSSAQPPPCCDPLLAIS